MKKLFVLALATLAFAACKDGMNTGAGSDSANGGASKIETVYDIAYIRMDSLVPNYNRYKDLSAQFETKATKVQSDLEARGRRLQNEIISFQERVQKGLMTRSQAEDEQIALERKGNDFEVSRQNQLTELAEEERVLTNQVMFAIQEYVAEYNADLRYKMILTTSAGAPIIHADPALDITGEILKGINEKYAAETPAAE